VDRSQLAGEKTLNRVGKISTAERKRGPSVAPDTAKESARGKAEQDRVPVRQLPDGHGFGFPAAWAA